MEKITARTNDKIKYAVRLGESASFRKQNGEFFLEGARLCYDAAKTGVEIKQAFFTAAALEKYSAYAESIIATGCICFEISGDVAKKLSDTENPQGVFCICKAKDKTESLNYSGKYLALENLQDPSNLGAVCRTVEALGLNGLIVSGGCDINNPKALRAAMDGQGDTIDDMTFEGKTLDSDSIIKKVYFYYSVASESCINNRFYIDNIGLYENYTDVNK